MTNNLKIGDDASLPRQMKLLDVFFTPLQCWADKDGRNQIEKDEPLNQYLFNFLERDHDNLICRTIVSVYETLTKVLEKPREGAFGCVLKKHGGNIKAAADEFYECLVTLRQKKFLCAVRAALVGYREMLKVTDDLPKGAEIDAEIVKILAASDFSEGNVGKREFQALVRRRREALEGQKPAP